MAFLYRNLENKQLYTIDHLKVDIHCLNAGGHCGIHAYPYHHSGPIIKHTREMARNYEIEIFYPEKFVEDNFEKIAELLHL